MPSLQSILRPILRRAKPAALAAIVSGLVTFSASSPAHACGAFFCDRPAATNPTPLIAQAAENVLFALDRDPVSGAGLVEAHIQIKYTGAADQFSWVVPVTSMPSLGVGSDVLFQILEPKTRPTFTLQWSTDGTCVSPGGGGGDAAGCGGSASSASSGEPYRDAAAGPQAPSVDVAFHGNVGPYDSAILRSDDATALETWLATNGYFVSPDASKIIAEYVATGSYFVALRLQSGRDVSEIQPIVLKLTAEEGCLPLKLTAIAATPDVRINVWVLGAARAVPINYTEVALNDTKLDWFTGGANYDQIVSAAANEAGGNAFVTEYAEPASQAVPWFTPPPGLSPLSPGATATPLAFWSAVQQLGLGISGRVLQVLRDQIPEPASLVNQGVTEAQFYGSLSYYWSTASASFAPFDPAAAGAELGTEVLQPMVGFEALFSHHPYLTRLATFISPEEMTKDPLFVTNATLPTLSNVHVAAASVRCSSFHTMCTAPVWLDVEGGRTVKFRPLGGGACNPTASQAFDRTDLDLDSMPSADRGWQRDATSEGTLVLDQGDAITAALDQHNAMAGGGSGDSGSGCAVGARGARVPGLLAALALLACLRRRRRWR